MTLHTSTTAYDFIAAAIEANGTATRKDFDIQGIIAYLEHLTGTPNPEAVEPSVFWEIVARHAVDPKEI